MCRYPRNIHHLEDKLELIGANENFLFIIQEKFNINLPSEYSDDKPLVVIKIFISVNGEKRETK